MDKDNYIVTVVVPVYNHERYIEQAIMSIYNQKTDYKYKVLIGEDKSTDNSREILKKLQKKLPENFIFLYREQNMGIQNFYDMYERITTKYYIVLEGDDFWCDDKKLQKQIEFIERHPQYIGVSHWINIVDQNGNDSNVDRKEITGEYRFKDYKNGRMPGHTSSKLLKYEFYDYKKKYINRFTDLKYPGDQIEAFLIADLFKIYCIPEKMSSYRYITDSGTSYSATHKFDSNAKINRIKFYYYNYIFSKENNGNNKITELSQLQYIFFMYRFRKDLKIPKELLKKEIRKSGKTFKIYIFILARIKKALFAKIGGIFKKNKRKIRN